ncbi:MAG TPA: PEP-CTERM sorting domain-containing protein [Nevskiaceae bacterium]|nr:PEP-CTERM sorting domain-containing protein [Nevskiaceae bacterium]
MSRLPSRRPSRFVSPGLAALAMLVLLAPAAANATPYVVKLTQQGTNVVAVGSGAFDLTGLSFNRSTQVASGMAPGQAFISTGSPALVDQYAGFAGPTSFGSGYPLIRFSEGSGDIAAIVGNDLFNDVALSVPFGYASGTALASSAAWDNASFASLGVTPGTYVWTWGTGAEQSFTLVTSVPEPAALGMFGFGVLLIGAFVGLRRRTA